MRVDYSDGLVVVTLSARNLIALQHKLQMPGSSRALGPHGGVYRHGVLVGSPLFVVRVEPDGDHYARRPEPPGPMHPYTEAFIEEMKDESVG